MEINREDDPDKTNSLDYIYAGFWIRFLALLIDYTILGVIGYIFFGEEVTKIDTTSGFSTNIHYTGWKAIIPVAYVLLFWTWLSATPGKMICGIKIIENGDRKLSWKKALMRLVAYISSFAPLFIGFIWIGFDKHKQGWHDKITHTYVVKKMKRNHELH